jgi:hypothetical protein
MTLALPIGRLLFCFGVFLFLESAFTQPLQREWIRTYFNVPTKINQATSIAIAPDGNIIVGGTSQNDSGDLDYEIIKYKANGDEIWRARYGSQNQGNDELRGMALDPAGNIVVTGTSSTVKYDGGGTFVWAAPLAGRAVIANQDYVYVTGMSDVDIVTAQLLNNSSDGREGWRRSVDGRAHAADIGQAITLDAAGNVYVAGQLDDRGCPGAACYRGPGVVSYTPGGIERWVGRGESVFPVRIVQANRVVVHPDGAVYVYGSYEPGQSITAFLAKFNQDGAYQWNYNSFASFGTKMIVDRVDNQITVTGRKTTEGTLFPQEATVMKFKGDISAPREIWIYQSPSGGWTEGSDIAQDSAGNLFVAGYTANDPDSYSNAILLVKMTSAGQQLGIDRYNDPGAVNCVGMAVAVDGNDAVYLTGYAVNAQGGSKFVTIKYSAAPKIARKSDGAMHLEFHTTSGLQYSIEGTTNFFNWQSLITNTADLNGLIQFDDADAPTIPYRFYRGKQP